MLGAELGWVDGVSLGDAEGDTEGDAEGNVLGTELGWYEGWAELLGTELGTADGLAEGSLDGTLVGAAVVGATLGLKETSTHVKQNGPGGVAVRSGAIPGQGHALAFANISVTKVRGSSLNPHGHKS